MGSITASVGTTCAAGFTVGTTSVGETGRVVTFSATGAVAPWPIGDVFDSIEFGELDGRDCTYV